MSIHIRNHVPNPNDFLQIDVTNEPIKDGHVCHSISGVFEMPPRIKGSFTLIHLVKINPDAPAGLVFTPFGQLSGFAISRVIGAWGTILDGPQLQRAVQIDKTVQFRGDQDFWGNDLYDFTTGTDWRERSAHAYGMAPYGLTAALVFRLEAGRKNTAGIAQVNVAGLQFGGSMEFRAQAKGYCRAQQKEAYADGVVLPVADDCRFWANANAESYGHVMGSGFILK